MKDISLTTDGGAYDLAFDGEDFISVDGRAAIAQELHIILRLHRGEWRLDERVGIDFFGRILGKGRSQVIRDAEIRRAIATAESIGDIVRYDVTLDTSSRELGVDFSVTTLLDGDDELVGLSLDPLSLPYVVDQVIPEPEPIADGYYVDGVLTPIPDGVWQGGILQGPYIDPDGPIARFVGVTHWNSILTDYENPIQGTGGFGAAGTIL
jgi:hypothetical protein